MATIKKPKLKSYPKKPKASASIASFENYLDKCKAIDKENKDKLDSYDKALKQKTADQKKKADLVKRVSSIGSAASKVGKRK